MSFDWFICCLYAGKRLIIVIVIKSHGNQCVSLDNSFKCFLTNRSTLDNNNYCHTALNLVDNHHSDYYDDSPKNSRYRSASRSVFEHVAYIYHSGKDDFMSNPLFTVSDSNSPY